MDYRLLTVIVLEMVLLKVAVGQDVGNCDNSPNLWCEDSIPYCTAPTHEECQCIPSSNATLYITVAKCVKPCDGKNFGCRIPSYCVTKPSDGNQCYCKDRYEPDNNDDCKAITCDDDEHMMCLDKSHCTDKTNNPGSCKCMPMYEVKDGKCQEIICEEDLKMKCLNRSDCSKEMKRESDDCVCMEGYKKSADTCMNIDECTEKDDEGNAIHSCDEMTQDCTDTVGSYTCTCKDGYRGDEKQCHPIFHCGRMEGACKNNGTCVMATGMCSCTEGYQLYDCSVETAKVSSDCNKTCENNGVCTERMNCHCKPGFTGETCSDKTVRLDECNVDKMKTTIIVQKGATNAQLMYIADNPNGHCDYKITSDEGTFITNFKNEDENCTNIVRRTTHKNNELGYTIKVLVQYNPNFQSKLDEVHVFTCIDDMASYSNFNLHNWNDLDEYYKKIINGKNNEVGHVPFEMSILDSEKEDIKSPVYLGDQVYLVFSIKDDSKHKYIKARPDTCTFYGKERSELEDNQKTDSAYSLKAIENKCPSKAAKTVLYKKFMEEEDGDDSDNSTMKTLVPFNVFQFSKSTDLYVYCTVKVCQRASDKQCTAEECKKTRRKRETQFIYRNLEAKAHLKIHINPRVRLYKEPNASVINTATFLSATFFTLAASAMIY